MTSLIEKWLLNTIGVYIPLSQNNIGEACFDGTLYAKILLKYNICSPEYLNLSRGKTTYNAYANLKQLSVWFRILNISFDDDLLKDISQKNDAPSLKLLYELFLKLEDKENMRLIDEKKKEALLSESTGKFLVTKVPQLRPEDEIPLDKEFMVDAINNGQDAIKLFLKKERNFQELCLEETRKRRADIMEALSKDQTTFQYIEAKLAQSLTQEKDVNIFKSLKGIDENLNMRKKTGIRGLEPCDPNEFISSLKASRRKKEVRRIWRNKNAQDTLDEAWKEIFMRKEEESRNILGKKLLKQAEPEKEMITRLRRSRRLYNTYIENKKMILQAEEKGALSRTFLESLRTSRDETVKLLENARIQEVYHKLKLERGKIRHENNYKECRSILGDIVDLAMVQYEYKMTLKNKPSKKKITSWKLMFVLGIPLFVSQEEEANRSGNPMRIEDKRSEVLAEYEFHLYNCLIGPWSLRSFEKSRNCRRRCQRKCKSRCKCGCKFSSAMERPKELNRIGNIVHRLLDLKYSYNTACGTPPDLPQYQVQALLRPVESPYIIDSLKNLLAKANIAVLDVNAATNYVIDAFNEYKKVHNPKTVPPKVKSSAKEYDFSKYVVLDEKTIQREEQIQIFKKRTFIKKLEVGDKYLDAVVQVPEEIEETVPREVTLGSIVKRHLSKGLLLSDILTCEIILEYIKSLKNIKGWVLLNFPNDLKQVAIMEYLLSGREVPYMQAFTDNIYLKLKSEFKFIDEPIPDEKVAYLGKNYTQAEKLLIRLNHPSMSDITFIKMSNIVPRCDTENEFPQYKSIFSRVVRVDYCSWENGQGETDDFKGENDFLLEEKDSPLLSMSVEDFYEGLKILVRFPIQKLNPNTMMALARVAMNEPQHEWRPGWKNSVDLFGFKKFVHTKPEAIRKQTMMTAARRPKYRDLFEGPVYSRPKLELLTKALYRVKEEKTPRKRVTKRTNHTQKEEPIIIQIGEKNLSKEYYEPLASIWESIEFFYIFNMTETLHCLSLIDSQFIPYRNFVVKKAKLCIDLNDDRKRIVSNFQLMLNSINDNLRQVKTMKNELQYRVRELQRELYRMSNVKEIFSNDILRRMIKKTWLPRQLCNYLKCYSRLIQVEVDRFVYTLEFITDYYSACTTEEISSQKPTSKIFFPKFEYEKNDSTKGMKQKTPIKQTARLSTKLSTKSTGKPSLRRFTSKHSQKKEKPRPMKKNDLEEPTVINCANSLEKHCDSAIHLLHEVLTRLGIRALQLNDSHKKISRETCYNQTGINSFRNSSNFTEEEDLLQNSSEKESIYNDWADALQEETDRLLFRLGLIEAHAKKNMNNQISIVQSAFEYFKIQVLDQYHKECLNIDKLCDLLRVAIEEEVKIQPSIIIDGDQFYVDPDKLMYPIPPPPEPRALEEVGFGHQMTAFQLTNFHHKMSYVAPLGVLKNIFIYILQEMATLGHELGYPYLPEIWYYLKEYVIQDLMNKWFGNKSIICWKDFIIFALDYPYPSLEQILSMKEQFEAHDPDHTELITKEKFMGSILWLDNRRTLGLEQTLRRVKLKELLFKLFQVNANQMNYSSFLLYICKDANPKLGLVKALAAVNGLLRVSWSRHLLQEPEDKAQENDKYDIAKSILREVILRVYEIEYIKMHDQIDENDIDLYQFLPKPRKHQTSHDALGESKEKSDKLLRVEITNTMEPDSKSRKSSILFEWSQLFTNFNTSSELMNYDVHFDTVLSIFIFYLQYYAIDPNHCYEHEGLEKNLNRIFSKKGDGFTIKLQVLLEDEFIENLLTSYRLFHAVNITQDLNLLIKTESVIAEEYEMQ